MSDIHTHLQTILEEANQIDTQEGAIEGTEEVIKLLEEQNLERMFDFALTMRDEELFNKLQQYNEN